MGRCRGTSPLRSQGSSQSHTIWNSQFDFLRSRKGVNIVGAVPGQRRNPQPLFMTIKEDNIN